MSIDEIVLGAIGRGEVPGAVVAVVRGDEVAWSKAYGVLRRDPAQPLSAETVFDLASLTKVIATTPAVLLLVQDGKLRVSDRVARHIPAFGTNGKDVITVEQVLLHTSGLPADNVIQDYEGGRDAALGRIHALRLASTPGTRFDYSDVGFIVLGELVEKVSGEPLDAFVHRRLFGPLGMADTMFRPDARRASRAAPTELRSGKLIQGQVHDPRAELLGGVAGHAGLFSTSADLSRFARMLLRHGVLGGARIFTPDVFAQMIAPHVLPGGATRGLGWDIQTSFSGNRGELPGGFGHTGFTGTSLWVDPTTDVAVIVLSSRLYPDGNGDPRRLRREVATAVAHGVLRTPANPAPVVPIAPVAPARVLNGIDVLERDAFALLKGARIGVVTNTSGRDRAGLSTVDVLAHAPGVTLVALFSPEHGLRGELDRPVPDGRDERTGLPVYSLYGQRTRPSDDQLAGIDTLIFDVQDVGARFYTFVTTLGYVLETAAKHSLRVVVLDRPNPVGGVRVEGPVLDPGRTSFVGYHALPVRHGMTVGELAQLFNQERKIGARLEVVRMLGWRRDLLFDQTDLRWVNPSPNLRSVDEALLYPGVALVEATNVSVGRGTDHPFEQVGAPWIDGSRLVAALVDAKLSGVSVSPTTFTPTGSAFAGQSCGGVALRITDRQRFEPIRTGLAIAAALARLYPKDWQPSGMLPQLGHLATYDAVLRGDALDDILARWQPDLAAFSAVRRKYLVY